MAKGKSILVVVSLGLAMAGCGKSLQGTYEPSNKKLDTLRFDPNGKVTSRDMNGKSLHTAPYEMNENEITIADSHFPSKLHMVNRDRLESKAGPNGVIVYSKE